MSPKLHLGWAVLLCAAACGPAPSAPSDAGAADAGPGDAGTPDAGMADAGMADAGGDVRAGLGLAVRGPAFAAQGACGRFEVEVLGADGGVASAPVALSVEVDGPTAAFGDEACTAALGPALVVQAGATSAAVWARWATPGASQVRAHEAVLGQAQLPVEVLPRVDVAAAARSALVVYNVNAPGAAALAEHYRQARGLEASQVCPVRMPPGMVATPSQLLDARDTIVEDCLCPLLPPASRPAPCDATQAAAIAAVSPISHLVLMAGLPQRLTATGWTTDVEGPSLAPFLASLVYRDDAIFGDDSKRRLSVGYPGLAPTSQHPPRLSPAAHPWVAFGQVEASSPERTRALIDRTLAAEAQGFTGNVVVSEAETTTLSMFLRDLTSTWAADCFDYLTHQPFVFGAPESRWPWQTCRFGTTWSPVASAPLGNMAGELGTTIPNPVGVGLSLATTPGPNTQVGFDGFEVMRRWHASRDACVELCREHPTREAVDACRAASTDVFRELDTSCVGVAPGFLGYQLRSWPVQFMGFLPPGWTTRESGELVKSVPRTVPAGGYRDARFTDDAFVRFGQLEPDAGVPGCGPGGATPCPERVVALLAREVPLPAPLPLVNGERAFTARVRYRSPASPGGALESWIVYGAGAREMWDVGPGWPSGWTLLDDARADWTVLQTNGVARSAALDGGTAIDRIAVILRVTPEKPAHGWLDFDGVELVDDATGTHLIDATTGGFAAEGQERNVPGDFAANVIDRLGGVGAWGSSSHFMTGGWAFRNTTSSVPMLFAGRTLGEALLAGGNLESGLVYADPLYRPVAVRLRSASGKSTVTFMTAAEWEAERRFGLSAFIGTAHLDDLRWALETCPRETSEQCTLDGAWEVQRQGVGAVEDVTVDVGAFLPVGQAPRRTLVRVRAWRPGDEKNALSSTVVVSHQGPK